MSHFIKAGLWSEKRLGNKGELDLDYLVSTLIPAPSTITVSNGLTKLLNNIKLGGILTETTVINGYYNLYLGSNTASNYLSYLELNTESSYHRSLLGIEFRGGLVGGDSYSSPYFTVQNIGASANISLSAHATTNYGSNITMIPYRIDLLTSRNAPDAIVTTGAILWKDFTGNVIGASNGSGELLEFRMRSGGATARTPTGAGLQYVWNDVTKNAEQGRFDILTHIAGTAEIRASLDRYGLYYPSDLSSNQTARYLVDKGYVDTAVSDIKLKKNLVHITTGLPIIMSLIPMEFDMIKDNEHKSGFIAQDIQKVLPHMIIEDEGILKIKRDQLVPYLVRAIQELKVEIDILKNGDK